MISDLSALFSWIVDLFSVEFTIYGFTFSMWQVFLFDIVVAIVAWFIGKVLLDE